VARVARERIVHVQAKDVRADRHAAILRAGGSFLDGVAAGLVTTPGDGDCDDAPLVAASTSIGDTGRIVIDAERDPALADPRA
jgi:inosose dehydratase